MASLILGSLLLLYGCKTQGNGKEQPAPEADAYASTQQIVSFVYHRFGDSRFPSTNVDTEVFEAHLQFLKDNNFTVTTLGDALERMESSSDNTARFVVITIDDGYRSFKENGWPLLQRFGFPATLFVNTESVGRRDYLTWDDLRQLRKEGVEIGNHSHTHPHFVNYSGEELNTLLENEITLSQNLFEEQLNFKPELFAYPYGENTRRIREFLKEKGFRAAAAQNSGVISAAADKFALPRFPMASGFASLESFKRKAHMNDLPLKVENSADHLIQENPPLLKAWLPDRHQINLKQAQFFLQGKNLSNQIKLIEQEEGVAVEIRAPGEVKGRRTLYTITAPSQDGGKWNWFSYLWINPSVEE